MINLDLSKQLSTQYQEAQPFPHIVIDKFLPETILNSVVDEFNGNKNWWYDRVKWTEPYQVNKFYWPHDIESAGNMQNDLPIISALVDYLNSPVVLKYLEELTGIKNLIGDELLMGGGLHKTTSGGKLAIHKDYMISDRKFIFPKNMSAKAFKNKVEATVWAMSKECFRMINDDFPFDDEPKGGLTSDDILTKFRLDNRLDKVFDVFVSIIEVPTIKIPKKVIQGSKRVNRMRMA